MKTKILFLFLIASMGINAQITDLKKLSSGKYYSSDIIKDSNNNIKGYFFLFESDKIAKETYELEYVVLDENLTKVTNGFITEMKYESWLISARNIDVNLTLYKNKLLIQFQDYFDPNGIAGYRRFRILDLQTNKISDPFIFNQGKMVINPKVDRKIKNYSTVQSEEMQFCNEVGLIVDSRNLDREYENRYLALYDDKSNEVWRTVYENGEDKKRIKSLTYMNSDKDILVYFNHFNKRAIYVNDFSVLLIDAKNGKIIKEFFFPNVDDYAYKLVDVVIKENEVTLLGNFTAKSDYGFTSDTDNTGLFSFRLDKKTGKTLDSKFIYWKNCGTKMAINSSGYIKDEGYIFIHNMLPLSDGRIIAVCETFLQQPITTNNMYFLELSKDLKLNQVFEVDKYKNKFPGTVAHSNDIKKNGLFDFMGYQNLGDDEFLFFLSDNEKGSKNRKKSTLYDVVSFADGKFNKQMLNLKTETSTISAFPSKKGYIALIENFDQDDKPSEIRLEKINY
ncbi:MAG TPA: hypothetical protein PKN96_04510 [Flavobacterium sp.]|uniref:DUF6770 family protein n=1 Tax=Flavobacterium sp. TaxID=239 RepID=UPI002B9CEFC0|nr:DUF6770 family protein [Flavobacterium sp.]HNP32530.1 hypothetical protein [Flavobacterium sp.]